MHRIEPDYVEDGIDKETVHSPGPVGPNAELPRLFGVKLFIHMGKAIWFSCFVKSYRVAMAIIIPFAELANRTAAQSPEFFN